MVDKQVLGELLKHIAAVEESYPLQEFNPLGAGGTADYFTAAHDTVELAASVKAAIDAEIPYVVIGAGAGVLFSDGGFPGLVIHNQAKSFAVAADKSQVVVDSGLPLSELIVRSASSGLGGLTGFYGEPGTVGGAVYANLSAHGQAISSSLRFVTMVMPPARLDREATVARYRADWLAKEGSLSKLHHLKVTRPFSEPQPVILAAVLQLTNIRSDELLARLHAQAKQNPAVSGMGPVFSAVPGHDLRAMLVGAGVASLRIGGIYPDRYNPNFLVSREKGVRSGDIRTLIEQMRAKVQEAYGVVLPVRYEYLGVW